MKLSLLLFCLFPFGAVARRRQDDAQEQPVRQLKSSKGMSRPNKQKVKAKSAMNKIGMMGMGKRGMMMSRKGAIPAPTSAPQAGPTFIFGPQQPTIADFIRSEPTLRILFLVLQQVNDVPLSQDQIEFIFDGNVPVILDSEVPPPIDAFTPQPSTPQPTPAPTPAPTNAPNLIPAPNTPPVFSSTTPAPTPQPTAPPIFQPSVRQRELNFVQNSPLRLNNIIQILDLPGSFTLFAATNDAFRLIGQRILAPLTLIEAYAPHREDLILYQVAIGARNISSFVDDEIIPAFNGENISVRTRGSTITTTVNNANLFLEVIDEQASNGVTQGIRRVLVPRWVRNSILDRVSNMGDLTILFNLLVSSGLDERLDRFEARENFAATLVAPTNSAFNNLVGTVNLGFLSDPDNEAFLLRVLQYHIIIGVLTLDRIAQDLTRSFMTEAPTNASTGAQREVVQGQVLDQQIEFNQATASSPDILLANNGALYKIDKVLNPDSVRGF